MGLIINAFSGLADQAYGLTSSPRGFSAAMNRQDHSYGKFGVQERSLPGASI